jgi:ParB family transcriptional regulator, chromosome partitioning protein
MSRKPLGRGLSALLGGDDISASPAESLESVNEIDIDLIDPNPDQPRTRFADKALDELAQSIAVNGIVQPIVVRKQGTRYQIVAGERRWRAAQRAGLRRIPAVAKEVSDDKLLELALIENIQRQELNPIEEATAYRNLIDSIGLTQEQVAERVGKERSLVATSLRLLKLPDDMQNV